MLIMRSLIARHRYKFLTEKILPQLGLDVLNISSPGAQSPFHPSTEMASNPLHEATA